MLGRLESVEAGSAIVKLAEAGEKKGNFTERLEQALDVIEDYTKDVQRGRMKAGLSDDETESLRKISEILPKTNKRNPGMMPI